MQKERQKQKVPPNEILDQGYNHWYLMKGKRFMGSSIMDRTWRKNMTLAH